MGNFQSNQIQLSDDGNGNVICEINDADVDMFKFIFRKALMTGEASPDAIYHIVEKDKDNQFLIKIHGVGLNKLIPSPWDGMTFAYTSSMIVDEEIMGKDRTNITRANVDKAMKKLDAWYKLDEMDKIAPIDSAITGEPLLTNYEIMKLNFHIIPSTGNSAAIDYKRTFFATVSGLTSDRQFFKNGATSWNGIYVPYQWQNITKPHLINVHDNISQIAIVKDEAEANERILNNKKLLIVLIQGRPGGYGLIKDASIKTWSPPIFEFDELNEGLSYALRTLEFKNARDNLFIKTQGITDKKTIKVALLAYSLWTDTTDREYISIVDPVHKKFTDDGWYLIPTMDLTLDGQLEVGVDDMPSVVLLFDNESPLAIDKDALCIQMMSKKSNRSNITIGSNTPLFVYENDKFEDTQLTAILDAANKFFNTNASAAYFK